MKARIEHKEETYDAPRTTYSKGWFGRTNETTTTEAVKASNVYLYVELTQEEQAIVAHRMLGEVVIYHMERDPADMIAELSEQLAATSDRYMRDELNFQIEALQHAKPHPIKLGTFLTNPHKCSFKQPHQANEYAVKLKEVILPKIKKLIQQHHAGPSSETFEV